MCRHRRFSRQLGAFQRRGVNMSPFMSTVLVAGTAMILVPSLALGQVRAAPSQGRNAVVSGPVAVSSAEPGSVKLLPGGTAEVEIKGSFLDRSGLKAKVLKGGSNTNAIRASFTGNQGNKATLKLVADDRAQIGDYEVVLKDGGKTAAVPLVLKVTAPMVVRLAATPQVMEPSSTRAPAVTPAAGAGQASELPSSRKPGGSLISEGVIGPAAPRTPSRVEPKAKIGPATSRGKDKVVATRTFGTRIPEQKVAAASAAGKDQVVKADPMWSNMHLEAKKFSGDFTEWSPEGFMEGPRFTVTFRWRSDWESIEFAKVEISDKPFPLPGLETEYDALSIRFAGDSAGKGKNIRFNVDFRSVASLTPDKEMKFYVRVRGWQYAREGSPAKHVGRPSRQVAITYAPPGDSTVFTTKGLYPEIWTPMQIRVSAGPLKIITADEPEDEEPWVILAILYADGTTIDLLKMGLASVRVHSTSGAHGNVWNDGDLDSGDNPHLLEGPWSASILPLGLEILELMESVDSWRDNAPSHVTLMDNTFIVVAGIAMEEDATSDSDATSIKNTIINSLTSEVNKAVKMIDLGIGSTPEDLQNQLEQEMGTVMANVMNAVQNQISDIVYDKIMTLPFTLHELIDADNFVGVAVGKASYSQILNGGGSVGTTLDFNSCGDCDAHYKLPITFRKM